MINLSEEQSNAVDLCCDFSHLIASVTGAAGTGKTSVLANVYERLVEEIRVKYSMEREAALEAVKLAAPTGRAAKRIEEATGISAVTIHRMLRFSVPSDQRQICCHPYR
jgi:exodeoxyribonuclease V alpha subunit